MNRQELESTLRKMTSEDFATFVKDFGGGAKSPDAIVRNYIDHPEWEPRLCQLLDFPTEEERRTQAILRSATSARWSAIAAAISAIIALLALLLALGIGSVGREISQQITPTDLDKPTASQTTSPGS